MLLGYFLRVLQTTNRKKTLAGKMPSGKQHFSLNLVPTVKVIDEVKKQFPSLFMLTFKYQENISHNELMEIAYNRLNSGYPAIVANRGEEVGPNGEQIAHLVTGIGETRKFLGKKEIAIGIADYLEEVWRKQESMPLSLSRSRSRQ
jgi:phosphopantothenoylcysteine decarboxylase/phosphopantothenate--cysteine ligase